MIAGTQIINGEKVEADVKSLSKAEEVLKAMIYKHLDDKKQAKKTARKEKLQRGLHKQFLQKASTGKNTSKVEP